MIRWVDLIGVAGFAMVLLSTLLLFPASTEGMNWKHWVEGLVLWFFGFNSVVGWLLLRWSVRQSKDGPPPLLIWSVRRPREGGITGEMSASHLRNEKAA
jgi:hypothetical protein